MIDPIREDSGNLSHAWMRAFLAAYDGDRHEVLGLTVVIRSSDSLLHEEPATRARLDAALQEFQGSAPSGRASIDAVAATIFPSSMWNPDLPREALFTRYRRIIPRLKKDRRNAHGMYFERFLQHDQLGHIIGTRVENGNNRRSAYQLAVFDAATDHGNWRQRGFPCLQQVSFVPDKAKATLNVFAYYATQTILEKAYGNYLGLWNLGRFVAHYWGLKMARLTCIAAVAKAAANDRSLAAARRLRQELEASK